MNFILFITVSILFFFIGILKGNCKRDRIYSIAYILIISLIFGFRTDTPDTDIYAFFYEQTDPSALFTFTGFYFEPGFQVISKLIKKCIGKSLPLYFTIWALLMGMLVMIGTEKITSKFRKQYCSPKLWIKCPILICLIMFYAYYGCFYGCITIRASIAIGLNLIVLGILSQKICFKNILLCIILIFLACLFHSSGIMIMLISTIYMMPIKLKNTEYLFIWAIAVFIFFSQISYLIINYLTPIINIFMNDLSSVSRTGLYTDSLNNANSGLSFKFMFQLLCGFLFLSIKNKDDSYYKLMNIYMIGLLIGSILSPISMAYRIMDFFNVVTYLLLLYYFSTYRSVNIPLYLSFVFFQIVLFYRVCNV